MSRQAGMTFIEMAVVMATLGIIIVASGLYLLPMESKVQSGAQLVESIIKQGRAKAIATTTVHRVRPLTASRLIVETASACSSGSWTAEPGLSVDLPRGVRVGSTAWNVCFNRRGIASENLVIEITHPEFDSRYLEVLRGGTPRWLE
ncbi:MAG: prepilin-type N-terminal cleavage/methylation domain-containing protein [bacterium]|nr:prepilin-type N-terminal cleavage/methylation domain-containing protein [bacterium]